MMAGCIPGPKIVKNMLGWKLGAGYEEVLRSNNVQDRSGLHIQAGT